MTNERPIKTPEELTEALKEAWKRIEAKKKRPHSGGNVSRRVADLANSKDSTDGVDGTKTKTKTKKSYTTGNLGDLGRKTAELSKQARKMGIDFNPNDDKETKTKKEKDENTHKKQEARKRQLFEKIKLPSGMELHQEGPSWVLISKNGSQRTDVTDIMSTIDKFNRDVDAKNDQNRLQNDAEKGVDKAAEVNKKDGSLPIIEDSDKVQMIEMVLPSIKNPDGEQLFKDEDIPKIAGIVVELEEREKQNNQNGQSPLRRAYEAKGPER